MLNEEHHNSTFIGMEKSIEASLRICQAVKEEFKTKQQTKRQSRRIAAVPRKRVKRGDRTYEH